MYESQKQAMSPIWSNAIHQVQLVGSSYPLKSHLAQWVMCICQHEGNGIPRGNRTSTSARTRNMGATFYIPYWPLIHRASDRLQAVIGSYMVAHHCWGRSKLSCFAWHSSYLNAHIYRHHHFERQQIYQLRRKGNCLRNQANPSPRQENKYACGLKR